MAGDAKPFRCCICEQLRERDTNHWWLVRVKPPAAAQAPSPEVPGKSPTRQSRYGDGAGRPAAQEKVELLPWNSVLARHEDVTLACGLNCLMVAAGRAAEALVARKIESERQENRNAD